MTFKNIFPGLSKTKVIFLDFPGPGLPGGVGTLIMWFTYKVVG